MFGVIFRTCQRFLTKFNDGSFNDGFYIVEQKVSIS